MRASIVVAIGVVGSEADLQAFMDLWVADSEVRAHKIADKVMGGRVTILPMEEIVTTGDDSDGL
jgi:hypothetical protein